jgi:hypothetical protein
MKTKNPPRAMEAGLVGWRERLAQRIEKPVSKRTPLSARQYVARALRRAAAHRR